MNQLPEPVTNIVVAIRDDLIGGAADMARETARALSSIASDDSIPDDDFLDVLEASSQAIVEVTPSIMPVTRVLHTVWAAVDASPGSVRASVAEAADGFVVWLDESLDHIASIGADLIRDGDRLFLYSMSSTVYRMIEAAAARGRRVSVVTTESRPGNEGLVTLSRLCPQGIDVTIGIDAALMELMRDCTAVYVGSDNVTSAGECLAKVGCSPSALAARYFGLPYYVAGDTSKFDPSSLEGAPISVREMPATDIVADAVPEHGHVRNPVFEMVPASLVTAYVTELGILHPGAVAAVMRTIPYSAHVAELVAAHARA